MSSPLKTASGIPLFKTTSTPTASRPSRPEPLATEPTGDLHLVGSVKTLPDGRFEIRSQYDPKASGFFHALPESRWVPQQQVWRCLATPLCGWMLRSVGLVLDGECQEMADKWDEAVAEPTRGSVDISMLKTTPRPHQIAAMEFSAKKPGSMQALDMGCISGEAMVTVYRCRRTKKMKLADLFAKFHKWDKKHDTHCRALVDGIFRQHRIVDVLDKGIRDVVKVTLEDGYEIICTPDHEIATDGEVYRRADSLQVGELVMTNGQCKTVNCHCIKCGKPMYRMPGRPRKTEPHCRPCDMQRRRDMSGDKSLWWKGGRFIDKDGYVRIHKPDHPRAWKIGYVYEHILVAEEMIGGPIPEGHVVHHKNENKSDNRPENLEVIPEEVHLRDRHACYRYLHGGGTINGGKVVVVPALKKVISVEPCGQQHVYDIVMADPHRNFVANGVVVHNCGKTLTAIGLMCHWRARKVLVLCPKAVLGVWRREMEKHCGLAHNVIVLDQGTGGTKAAMVKDGLRQSERWPITMVVVNYESSWRDPLGAILEKEDWDLSIYDESHRLSSSSSTQSIYCSKIAQQSNRKLLLTGTPMDSPLDLFAQYKIIEPALFGTSFSRFRSRYAVTHAQYKNKILSLINQDDFISKYKQLAFRVETLDVWDLPELTNSEIPVMLEPKTMKEYKTLAKQSLLEIEQGLVTASTAGVRLLRLAMMACGHCKTEDGKTVRLGNEKKEALTELLSDLPKNEPVVVFARFTEDLRQIEEVSKTLHRRYGEVSGSRKDLTPHSTMPDNIDLLGVQEQSGGVGIDLTRARYCVYFSHGYSLKTAEQSSRRVYRPGQEKKTFIYHLCAQNTVDEAIMRALESKSEIVGEVLKHVRWAGA